MSKIKFKESEIEEWVFGCPICKEARVWNQTECCGNSNMEFCKIYKVKDKWYLEEEVEFEHDHFGRCI